MKALAAVVVLLVGCGRLGFDAVGGSPGDDEPEPEPGGVSFDYPRHNINAVQSVTSVSLIPQITKGTNIVFSVAPALPTGLALNATTGEIRGIPMAALDGEAFTVTGTGTEGSATVDLSVTVLPGYVVDVLGDGADDDDGANATCFSTAAGGCSLRAAVQTANGRPGKQMVLLGPGVHTVDSSVVGATDDIVIAGDGTTIRPTTLGDHRFMRIVADVFVAIENLRFDGFGGGNDDIGGTIQISIGELAIDECEFVNGSGGQGAVLDVSGGVYVEITDSTFLDNASTIGNGWGGVINGNEPGTTIMVRRCYAEGNFAVWGSFAHLQDGAFMQIENTTLTRNEVATSGTLASPGGSYHILNSTIAYNTNTNPDPANPNEISAGIYIYRVPGQFTVENSIIAHNTLSDGSEVDCRMREISMLGSSGSNLIGSTGDNCASAFTMPMDRLNVDPGIDDAALANGGLTRTIALLPDSPAIDSGNTNCPDKDQRERPRVGARCDIGAYEANSD